VGFGRWRSKWGEERGGLDVSIARGHSIWETVAMFDYGAICHEAELFVPFDGRCDAWTRFL
jgi:hypothetical protein